MQFSPKKNQGYVVHFQQNISGLFGEFSGLCGAFSGLFGEFSGLCGVFSGLFGEFSGLCGEFSGLCGAQHGDAHSWLLPPILGQLSTQV